MFEVHARLIPLPYLAKYISEIFGPIISFFGLLAYRNFIYNKVAGRLYKEKTRYECEVGNQMELIFLTFENEIIFLD